MFNDNCYLNEEIAAIRELTEKYGMNGAIAEDCVASRNTEEMEIVLTFLRRYGHLLNVGISKEAE